MGMSIIEDLFHHAACIICSHTDGTRPDVVCNCSNHDFSVAREDLAKRGIDLSYLEKKRFQATSSASGGTLPPICKVRHRIAR